MSIADFSPLTAYLDSLPERFSVPGCDCAVLHGHEVIYRHSVGFADSARTRPVSRDDLYYLFSATKLVTCTAVLQLAEQGRLSLEDPLARWLPEFGAMQVLTRLPQPPILHIPADIPTQPARRPIRIADLLTMTAGLSYDMETPAIRAAQQAGGGRASTRQIVAAIAQSPLLCEPGTHWIYSLAHDVLGAVVEAVSGMTFGAYLQQNVFGPLGMEDVWFHAGPETSPRIAALYARSPRTQAVRPIPVKNMFELSKCYESGGAGLLCSADAYLPLVGALCSGGTCRSGARLLKRETIDQMRKNWLTEAELADFRNAGKVGYGYGLGVRTLIDAGASRSPLGEFGWDGAAGAYVLADVEHEIGIFYVQHILFCPEAYSTIHPMIRDLVYRALEG